MASKVKWAIGGDEPEAAAGGDFTPYDGPIPPAGIYSCVLKKLWLTENKNGEQMLKGVLEIAEDDKEKKQFNGYGIWFNQNVTEQGAPYVKQFLAGIGATWKEFYEKTVTADDEDNVGLPVTKIGKIKIDGDTEVRVQGKRGKWDGEVRLEVRSFLPLDDDGDGDGDGDDGETPF